MGRSVEQKRKSRNLRKKRKRAERYKSKREEKVQTRVEAIVRVIRKDFDQQKRIASKYYNKWKQCVLDANNNFKKSESPKVNQLYNNLSPVYTSKFYLTNFICQRYFARVDDTFVTNLL